MKPDRSDCRLPAQRWPAAPYQGLFVGALVLASALLAPRATGQGAATSGDAPEASRVVPEGHPRLLATAAELPALRARFAAPRNEEVADWLRSLAARDDDGTLPDGQPDRDTSFTFYGKAILYGLEGDEAVGRSAIDMAMAYFGSVTATYEEDGLFASRAINAALRNAAFVYDWCHDLFVDDDERRAFISEALRVATQTEYGWPLTARAEYFVGSHYCEETHPTLLALGIAIFDEDPSVFDAVAPHLTERFAPVRNFVYAGHRHHQGNAYGPSRFAWEVVSALYASRLDAPAPYVAEQGQVPYYSLYTRMPDGYTLVEGDDWQFLFPPRRVSPLVLLALAATHQDGYLLDLARRYDKGTGGDRITMFLVADEELEPEPVEELPLSRYFGSPFGTVVARTGWDLDGGVTSPVAAARMSVDEYFFGNHDHLDAGHFSLYYKGALAIDSGNYGGGGYGKAHHRNYNQRSVAHNTILVLDPDEPRLRAYRGGPELARDGGQMWVRGTPGSPVDLPRLRRMYERCTILAHSLGPEGDERFSFLKGDLAGAYAAPPPYPAKVERALRSFVFIDLESADHPAALIVYDVVRAADAGFEKRWLLHSVAEPVVADGVTTVLRTDRGFNGKLVNHTLLPKRGNRVIDKVGGPGREFWVEGENYPAVQGRLSPEAGAWRIELRLVAPAVEDRFLNVMQVSDASRDGEPGPDPLPVTLIDEADVVGAAIASSVAVFSRSGDLLDRAFNFVAPSGSGDLDLLVTDLSAGRWRISTPAGEALLRTVTATAQSCRLSSPGGEFRFEPLR